MNIRDSRLESLLRALPVVEINATGRAYVLPVAMNGFGVIEALYRPDGIQHCEKIPLTLLRKGLLFHKRYMLLESPVRGRIGVFSTSRRMNCLAVRAVGGMIKSPHGEYLQHYGLQGTLQPLPVLYTLSGADSAPLDSILLCRWQLSRDLHVRPELGTEELAQIRAIITHVRDGHNSAVVCSKTARVEPVQPYTSRPWTSGAQKPVVESVPAAGSDGAGGRVAKGYIGCLLVQGNSLTGLLYDSLTGNPSEVRFMSPVERPGFLEQLEGLRAKRHEVQIHGAPIPGCDAVQLSYVKIDGRCLYPDGEFRPAQ